MFRKVGDIHLNLPYPNPAGATLISLILTNFFPTFNALPNEPKDLLKSKQNFTTLISVPLKNFRAELIMQKITLFYLLELKNTNHHFRLGLVRTLSFDLKC